MSTQAAPIPAETRIDRLSPDSLVASFSQSHLVRWFLVAFAMHTVVIGAFSIGYVRDLIDPVGAAARKAEVIAAAKAVVAAAAAAAAPPADPAAKPGDGKIPQSAEKSDGKSAEKSPIEKATSEAAKPDEIPATPDDLGLSIEDTNPE
jgi:hypothetical protein